MNVYCELQIDRIRLKIDGDEISFQVNAGFYAQRMMSGSGISSRIKGFVQYQQSDMNLLQKIRHRMTKNRVYILVNLEVQQYVTLRQIHEFAVNYLDGGSMYIIPKPAAFDSTNLESIESIGTEYIRENQNRDTVIAQLRTLARPANPAYK